MDCVRDFLPLVFFIKQLLQARFLHSGVIVPDVTKIGDFIVDKAIFKNPCIRGLGGVDI
jgi:hypothetical protein